MHHHVPSFSRGCLGSKSGVHVEHAQYLIPKIAPLLTGFAQGKEAGEPGQSKPGLQSRKAVGLSVVRAPSGDMSGSGLEGSGTHECF